MNFSDPEDRVAALFESLLEGEETTTEPAEQSQETAPTVEPTAAADTEIGLLQEILVSPGLRQLQERCSTLEKRADESEARLQALEAQVRDLPAALIGAIEPVLAELLDRKLTALEANLLAKLDRNLEQHIEARVSQPQSLSIRVVGTREDSLSPELKPERATDRDRD